MVKKETTERKPFNFGVSTLVKTTEKTMVEGYEAIEKKEQGHTGDSPSVNAPLSQQGQSPSVPEPTQNINVPIPVSLHQQLKVFAAQTKQNMKDLVVVAIKEYMDHQPK